MDMQITGVRIPLMWEWTVTGGSVGIDPYLLLRLWAREFSLCTTSDR